MSTQAIDGPISELDLRKPRSQAGMIGAVTLWLALAILIGASIAVYDGLHRKWMTELETLGPAVALTYTANRAAWVFAGVVLPFVLLHGRKLRFSLVESLLLWFVLCTVAYTRDFAYLKIPGAPIYVTDVILVLALVRCFAGPQIRWPSAKTTLWIGGFLLLGIFDALRGLRQHMLLTDILRDLSVPVYSLFALPALYARRSKAFTEQFWLMIVCGALIATLIAVGWYEMQPGMRRYVISGMYVPLGLLLTVIAMVWRQLSLRIAIPLVALLSFGLLLCNARSVYIGRAAAFALLLLTGFGKRRAKVVLAVVVIAFCIMAAVATARLRMLEDARLTGAETGRVTSALLHPRADDNTHWRLLLWKEAAHRFLQHPLFGEGFGVPLIFELVSSDTKPHNIYLFVFYKMGVAGGAVFLVLLLAPTLAACLAIRRYSEHPDVNLLRGLLVCQVFLFCWGALNPLIETPFLASIFWLNLGLLLRMARRMESGGKRIAAAAAA